MHCHHQALLLVVGYFVAWAAATVCPTEGDTCATAYVIESLPFSDSGSNCAFADDYNEFCPFLGVGGRDVVYRYTPPEDVYIDVDLCASDYDTKVYIYAGDCPEPDSGEAIACNDDACGVNGYRSFLAAVPLSANVDYYIVVDAWGAADCGQYALDVTLHPPPPGETCATAHVIQSLPFSDSGDNSAFADDYNEFCPFLGVGGRDVVYRYTPSEDVSIDVDLCASDYDTKVYIYADDCPDPDSGEAIACNDDACGVNGYRSFLPAVPLTANVDYYIVVDAWGAADCGQYLVDVTVHIPPPGDTCANAIEIGALPFSNSGDTCPYADTYDDMCQFILSGGRDVVYHYLPPRDEYVNVDLCASTYNTEVYVYEGACPPEGPAVTVACNDDACGQDGTQSLLAGVPLSGGIDYYIVVDGYGALACGAYELRVQPVRPVDYPSYEIAEVAVGDGPIGLCALPSGDYVYVANWHSDTVSVIETACNGVVDTIPVGEGPYRICTLPSGEYVYTANSYDNSVSVIRTADNTVVATVPVGTWPVGVCALPSGEYVYVTDYWDNAVSVIRTSDNAVIQVIPVGTEPRGVVSLPSGKYVYTSNWRDATVSVIRTSDHTLVDTVPVGYNPQAIWAMPSGEYVLVGNFGYNYDETPDYFSVIRTADNKVVATVETGTGLEEICSLPSGDYIYVTNWGYTSCCPGDEEEFNQGLGVVTIIETPDFASVGDPNDPPHINATVKTVERVGEYCFGICMLPSGDAVYVANFGSEWWGGCGLPFCDMVSVIGFPSDESAPPAGDTCDSAIVIDAIPFADTGNTACGFADDQNEACPSLNPGGRDVVYRYTAAEDRYVHIDLCSSNFDTKAYVFEGECPPPDSGQAIACNDDACGSGGSRSRLAGVALAAGETYYIVVDGHSPADSGAYELHIDPCSTGDLDCDGCVEQADLGILLAGWGCTGGDCPGDLDGDDDTDQADLGILLAHWGEGC